jgi:hypothetical protein
MTGGTCEETMAVSTKVVDGEDRVSFKEASDRYAGFGSVPAEERCCRSLLTSERILFGG